MLAASGCTATYATGYYRSYSEPPQFARVAYDKGFEEGLEHGRSDARAGRPFGYARQGDYRDADEGYDRRFGSLGEYREHFRRGFVAGYSEAYQTNSRVDDRWRGWR
jgi:hypothetical protein